MCCHLPLKWPPFPDSNFSDDMRTKYEFPITCIYFLIESLIQYLYVYIVLPELIGLTTLRFRQVINDYVPLNPMEVHIVKVSTSKHSNI